MQDTLERSVDAAVVPTEVLAFRIGGEEYAIDILKVREIRGYERPTRIAGSGPSLCGVLNLRGTIVPIVDLRRLLGVDEPVLEASTVTIILGLRDRSVGVVVDAVADVLSFEPGQVRAAPEMSGSTVAPFVLGLVSIGDRMLMALDVEGYLDAATD
ncbi:MAG TPA: chemotaxis protein CheW [Burkholderiaceae bacterium]|nr:chemotaxis protein CheW [Burkholderiaceae bacterium]